MRIALVGDSHSQVLWPRLKTALEAAGHQVVLSEATPGWAESKYISSGSLPDKLKAAQPDLVVYELGGNNMSRIEADYRKGPETLVKLAKDVGASVVWFGPAAVDASKDSSTSIRHESTADMQSRILPALGVTWVDSRPFTVNSPNHQPDGVHFTGTGYTLWAKAMLPAILQARPPLAPATMWLMLGGGLTFAGALAYLVRRKRRKSRP